LLVPLRLLAFELRQIAARGLPLLTGADGVLGHVVSLLAAGSETGTPGSAETHRQRHPARRSSMPARRAGGPLPAPRLSRNRVRPSVESSSSATTQVTRPSAP